MEFVTIAILAFVLGVIFGFVAGFFFALYCTVQGIKSNESEVRNKFVNLINKYSE